MICNLQTIKIHNNSSLYTTKSGQPVNGLLAQLLINIIVTIDTIITIVLLFT